MTTVSSRAYADTATAEGVVTALKEAGFPDANIDLIQGGGGSLQKSMIAARVPEEAVDAYVSVLSPGTALVVARSELTPFGAARTAMSIMNAAAPLPVALETQDHYIREQPDRDLFIGLSILKDHPRFLSSDMNPRNNANRGLVSTAFAWPLLTAPRRRHSAMSGGGFMSQRILPFPLLSDKPRKNSVIRGGGRMLYKRG